MPSEHTRTHKVQLYQESSQSYFLYVYFAGKKNNEINYCVNSEVTVLGMEVSKNFPTISHEKTHSILVNPTKQILTLPTIMLNILIVFCYRDVLYESKQTKRYEYLRFHHLLTPR